MVQLSPDTTATGWYKYRDSKIRGFSLTHFSGAGCPAYADVPFLPAVGPLKSSPGSNWSDYAAAFSHDKEQAAAEKRVAALIAAFTPTKNGRLDYPLIEKVNARHRGWFEDAKKDGKDLLKVEEQIRRDQQVTYDRVERDSWKM